jgi:hypothetical protein
VTSNIAAIADIEPPLSVSRDAARACPPDGMSNCRAISCSVRAAATRPKIERLVEVAPIFRFGPAFPCGAPAAAPLLCLVRLARILFRTALETLTPA